MREVCCSVAVLQSWATQQVIEQEERAICERTESSGQKTRATGEVCEQRAVGEVCEQRAVGREVAQ